MNYLTKLARFEGKPGRLAFLLFLPIASVCIGLMVLFSWFDINAHRDNETNMLIEASRAYFQQVMITWQWNAAHGGVYVPVTEQTRPNMYLDDPRGENLSVAGVTYTKIDPAFMTRQISEMTSGSTGNRFHITSLKPVNPGNVADLWEKEMLQGFVRGEKEATTVVDEGGRQYFRYMAPLRTDKNCLGCHVRDGYRENDVMGGVSISIPVAVFRQSNDRFIRDSVLRYGVVGLVVLGGLFTFSWLLAVRMTHGITLELEDERLKVAMEMAGAAAHELRQPLTVIGSVTEILMAKNGHDEEARRCAEILAKHSARMNEILKQMLAITHYRTKPYLGRTRIVDLDAESDEDGNSAS